MPEKVDVNDVFSRSQVTLKPEEHPEERTARLRAESRNALMETIKDTITFGVVIVGILVLAIMCAIKGLFDPTAPADTIRWAQTVLAAIVTGAVSFILGRRSSGNK